MLILLVWKPGAASAEGIESAAVYFRARTRTGFARYTSACGARHVQFTPLLSVPGMNAPTILDLSPLLAAAPTANAASRA
jgi:hypothetical protein